MKQVLCIYLRHWPIDRLRRRRDELRHKPFVLVETAGGAAGGAGRQIVAHVSPDVPRGIRPGMTLAEARARFADLIHLPASPADDLRGLEALGRWLMRFSPNVALDPPCALFLDATGLRRLFGDLPAFRQRVAAAVQRLRLSATLAIAPTPAAAWALAASGESVVVEGDVWKSLAPLPPAALRLDELTLQRLASLGIGAIAQLLRLPRHDLAAHFGPGLLQRIDQASGTLHQPLIFLQHHVPISASIEFDAPLESLEAITLAARELLHRVVDRLACGALGARQLRLIFRPPYLTAVEKIVRLTRPSRDEAALCKLIVCAIEALETDEGFISITLDVPVFEHLDDAQARLAGFGGEEERDAAEVDHLVERLRARLDRINPHAVQWAQLVESHVPEHAFRRGDIAVKSPPAPETARYRPLCLLPRPRPIQVMVMPSESRDGQPISFTDGGTVHRLLHAFGPERITGQWWNGRWKTRDYFDVLDAAGNRYWLFRVLGASRWFVHGIFE
ncbi:MAG TPA: DNA polymerase Y family protein [Tepidisphaeraceae bacterium]|nr:DNA polymerase Y family protein [Tepidisphaeraceae bacterium]